MTGLLVSVRDLGEAETSLAAGADLIDLKEPSAGSLGAVSPQTMQAVAQWLAGRRPLSVALGELDSLDPDVPAQIPVEAAYAKLGLARCAGWPDWPVRWQATCRQMPLGVQPVAVVYADWITAASPEPREILAAAADRGAPVVLIDTFDKRSGNLFDVWPVDELKLFAAAVRKHGLKLVLGGSLNLPTIEKALELEPDYIAVRGAACRLDRNGRLDGELVARIRKMMSRQRAASASGR